MAKALATIWILLSLASLAPPPAQGENNVTSYQQLRKQIAADAARCPLIRVCVIGKAASGRREILLVRCGAPGETSRTARLLILCRQHGDEPASTEAMLHLLSRFSQGGDPELEHALSSVTLYIVPMVNPDGADANMRRNADGADLNRDWGPFTQPETRAVQSAVDIIKPNLIVDAHNWDGSDTYDANCIEVCLPDQVGWHWAHSSEPQETTDVSWARFRDDPRVSRIRELQSAAIDSLARTGYDVNPTGYGPGSDPQLAHRYFMSHGILSMLVETHAGASDDFTDFERRQGMYTALVHFLVRNFAALGPTGRTALNGIEGYQALAGSPDTKLFSPDPSPAQPTAQPKSRRSDLWLVPIAVLVFVLIAVRAVPLRHAPPSAAADRPLEDLLLRGHIGLRASAYSSLDPRFGPTDEPSEEHSPAGIWRCSHRAGMRKSRR